MGEAATTACFTGGYLAVWSGFSAAATLLQWQLDRAGLLTASMTSRGTALTAGIMLIAGAYQLTPAKRAFLRACHAPASRRSGAASGWAAFATGTRLGLRCLGCCWALMTVMFAVGLMSIAWTAALTALVAIEKMRAPESRTGRVAGAAFIAWALVILATAGR